MKRQEAKAVGRRLRETRERLGWEREELAERLGVHPGSIARWETGGSVPQPYHLERIAEWADVTPEWLREGRSPGAGARAAPAGRGRGGARAGATVSDDEPLIASDRLIAFLRGLGPAGEDWARMRKLDALDGYRRMITAAGRPLPDEWYQLRGKVERDDL